MSTDLSMARREMDRTCDAFISAVENFRRTALLVASIPVMTPEIEKICSTTAEAFGIPLRAVWSAAKADEIVRARHVAIELCKRITEINDVALGDMLGREHSTISYARKSVKSRMLTEKTLSEKVDQLEADLRRQLAEVKT